MKAIIIFSFTIFLFSNTSFGQYDGLEKLLFEKTEFVEFKIDTSEYLCKSHPHDKLDTEAMKTTKKKVVNSDSIITILKEIAFQKQGDIKVLNEYYSRFLAQYEIEWGEVYKNRCISRTDRKFAEDQIRILAAFETTLYSLNLKDKSDLEIWECVVNRHEIFQKLMSDPNSISELLNQLNLLSPLYKELITKGGFALNVGFAFHEPYLEELEEFYIELLKGCNCPIRPTCNIDLIRQQTDQISRLTNPKIPEIFIDQIECVNSNQIYFWVPIVFLENRHHEMLLHEVLELLLKEEPEGHVLYKLSHIYRNEQNRKIIKRKLRKAGRSGNQTAIQFSQRIQLN